LLRERTPSLAQRDSVQRQLEVIKSIDNDRFIWAHIMDEVSRALPPYTWLKSIQQSAVLAAASTPAPPPPPPPSPAKDGAKPSGKAAPPPPPVPAPTSLKFQIAGNTVDIQALTRFMKLLEASPFVKNVTIAKAELVSLDGKEVQEFLLEAEYERPDASVISTVPVTLSSR
jgi:Tfp pilus assembly protein PilN